MFNLGAQVNHNNCNYTVVRDHVVSNNILLSDDQFIFDKRSQVNIDFIASYESIDNVKNPVGFWHTILNNIEFDFTQAFKYKFELNEQTYYFSFDLVKFIIHESNLIDGDEFELLNIDVNKFNKFEIITTEAEKKSKSKHQKIRFFVKHFVFWIGIVAVIVAYIAYKDNIYQDSKVELDALINQTNILQDRLEFDIANKVDFDTSIQDQHIARLAIFLKTGVNIKGLFNLDEANASVEIDIKNIDLIKSIMSKENFDIQIESDFVKKTAMISWSVDSD